MTQRSYKHYCGVARALDLVGERWALLVVRELLFGPKRYSDLLAGLPGISTNILAARLQELEQAELVARRTLAPPAASAVYELTARGRELEEAILSLGRWGGRTLGRPSADRTFLPAWGLLALRASFHPERADGLRATWEFRIDGELFHVQIAPEEISFGDGPASSPDLVVATDAETFLALGLGELSAADAIRTGRVELDGDAGLLSRAFDVFRFPAAEPLAGTAEPAGPA